MYLLTLEGDFEDEVLWLPDITPHLVHVWEWDLKLKKKRENNLYSEDSCVGSGQFIDASIEVSKYILTK
jgi:hypothetical protein